MKRLVLCWLMMTSPLLAAQGQLGPFLTRHLASFSDTDQILVFITFKDKGDEGQYRAMAAKEFLSEHAIQRRALVRKSESVIDEQDYPVKQSYIEAVIPHVLSVRHVLKWFNGVSAFVTKQQIAELQRLPMVSELELIGRWKRQLPPVSEQPVSKLSPPPGPESNLALDYGTSFTQVNQINVPAVHNLGIYGQGVTVGVFDNGVRLLTHEAFASMNIIAQQDFVDHKTSVVPNNTNSNGISFGGHGTNTLSVIGGYKPGQLIGPAFKANFILARTENDSSETPIEEDNWAAGIEWAESLGVEVTSTSLGYLGFDTPYVSLTWQDMNGHTALITNAADRAVGLGVTVLNSAGNGGLNTNNNTLIAPADGDSVISVGAVTSTGARSSFSSVGPTTDVPARIKPDIMAMGSSDKEADALNTTGYVNFSGTSYSCPLAAGVAALIKCANPTLTPMQIREAMRQTASQPNAPDNLMGWGIINALSAINYYGILPLGKVRGIVFNDYNGNGIRDTNEPGIRGIAITCTGAKAESTVTDSNGAYLLDSLPIGSFAITENIPANYVQSSPQSGSDTVSVLFNVDTSGFNFGIYSATGAIHGIVFNDQNNNAVMDLGEPGITNWRVTLSGPLHKSTLTDSIGNYSFADLLPGEYTVSESLKSGYAQSLPPGNVPFTIFISTSTDTGGMNFGVANLPAFTYQLVSGWNLLSLPQDPADHALSVVYPSAISSAFVYTGSYQPLTVIPNSLGYWLRLPSNTTATFDGNIRLTDSLDLVSGWNLIGTLSYPLPRIAVGDSAGIINSFFFGYNGGYVLCDTLMPNLGYWVKASANGRIVLTTSAPPRNLRQNVTGLPQDMNTLSFTDAVGHHEILYFTSERISADLQSQFDLPPTPPEGAFDARYASASMLAAPGVSDDAEIIPIKISGAEYPVAIAWQIKEKTSSAVLKTSDKTIPLAVSGSTVLIREGSSPSLVLNSPAIPKRYALEQNYPNPFNPTTLIRYQLPVAGWVTLKVFDVIGREIRTLVNEREDAGYKAVVVDANNLPSGIYFYRLTAGKFVDVRKMVVMR